MRQELDFLGYVQFDHHVWLNELIFSNKEIKFYESRLLELMEKNEEESILDELSDLYNSFNQKDEEIEELIRMIRKHVVNNSRLVRSNGSLKSMIDSMHATTRIEMEKFRKDYSQLKERFNRFSIIQNGLT